MTKCLSHFSIFNLQLHFILERNFNLSYRSDTPQLQGLLWDCTSPKAILILVHGMGEHIGRYEHVAKHFNDRSIAVFGTDLTGFGMAHGKKGHGVNLLEMKHIVRAKVDYAAEHYPAIPIIIFGQSMGGNIALNYQLSENDSRVSGYIAASPWIQTGTPLSPVLIFAASILSRIAPKVTKSNDLVVEGISDMEIEVKKYISDPLVHDRVSFGFGYDMFLGAEYLDSYNEGSLKVNTLISHSKDDILTSAKASKAFAKRNPAKLKYLDWENLGHELHNSSKKAEILNTYSSWVESHL